MPVMKVGPGRALVGGGGETYDQKVLATGPIAYWPLWETSGTVAHCLVNPLQDGTYNSDVSGWPPGTGIGDGNTAPFFDGTNDCINIQTAALQAALDGSAGTLAVWQKVNAAAVWTDAANRRAFYTADVTDWQEFIHLTKSNVANTYQWRYQAGGVLETVNEFGMAGVVAWFHTALTWDAAADQVKAYLNGVQTGVTQTILGVWAGTVDVSVIGAESLVPANPWHGWLAHAVVLGRAATPAEIVTLATV